MWVPLVENNEHEGAGADFFVKKHLDAVLATDPQIDTLILACTHYPLMLKKLHEHAPKGVRIVPQGKYVAESLDRYLRRHPDMAQRCTKGGRCHFLTTESAEKFSENATRFLHSPVQGEQILLQ